MAQPDRNHRSNPSVTSSPLPAQLLEALHAISTPSASTRSAGTCGVRSADDGTCEALCAGDLLAPRTPQPPAPPERRAGDAASPHEPAEEADASPLSPAHCGGLATPCKSTDTAGSEQSVVSVDALAKLARLSPASLPDASRLEAYALAARELVSPSHGLTGHGRHHSADPACPPSSAQGSPSIARMQLAHLEADNEALRDHNRVLHRIVCRLQDELRLERAGRTSPALAAPTHEFDGCDAATPRSLVSGGPDASEAAVQMRGELDARCKELAVAKVEVAQLQESVIRLTDRVHHAERELVSVKLQLAKSREREEHWELECQRLYMQKSKETNGIGMWRRA